MSCFFQFITQCFTGGKRHDAPSPPPPVRCFACNACREPVHPSTGTKPYQEINVPLCRTSTFVQAIFSLVLRRGHRQLGSFISPGPFPRRVRDFPLCTVCTAQAETLRLSNIGVSWGTLAKMMRCCPPSGRPCRDPREQVGEIRATELRMKVEARMGERKDTLLLECSSPTTTQFSFVPN